MNLPANFPPKLKNRHIEKLKYEKMSSVSTISPRGSISNFSLGTPPRFNKALSVPINIDVTTDTGAELFQQKLSKIK